MRIFKTLKNSPLHVRRFWQSIMFYIIMLSIAFIVGYIFLMGPCADFLSAIPMFLIMGTAITSIVLIVKSIILIIKEDKRYILTLLAHISFWVIVGLLIIIDSSKY